MSKVFNFPLPIHFCSIDIRFYDFILNTGEIIILENHFDTTVIKCNNNNKRVHYRY